MYKLNNLLHLLFDRFYVWDILHASIRKMCKTVQRLENELDELKDRKDEADNKVGVT